VAPRHSLKSRKKFGLSSSSIPQHRRGKLIVAKDSNEQTKSFIVAVIRNISIPNHVHIYRIHVLRRCVTPQEASEFRDSMLSLRIRRDILTPALPMMTPDSPFKFYARRDRVTRSTHTEMYSDPRFQPEDSGVVYRRRRNCKMTTAVGRFFHASARRALPAFRTWWRTTKPHRMVPLELRSTVALSRFLESKREHGILVTAFGIELAVALWYSQENDILPTDDSGRKIHL
jgi:hypothetical protein